jgi:dihydroorotate dehydrogenase
MTVFYQVLFSSVLRHMDAEKVHKLSFAALRGVTAVPGVAETMERVLGPREPELTVHALGREFPGPLGMAAGFDKNAESPRGLAALGFGGHLHPSLVMEDHQTQEEVFRLRDRQVV